MKRTTMIGLALAAALSAGQANAQELTGTLKNIKDTGAITLGFRDSSIPFSYLDDNQKPIGYAMDICYKIVDAVKKELKLDKLEVKLNPVTSSTRIPLLANGTIDLECGSTTNNAERQKQICLHQHPLPDREPLRHQEGEQDQFDRRSQGQVGGLHRRHHQHQAAHRSQRGARPQRQHHSGQGSRRGVPDGRDRPRGRLRDGRHPAGEPGRRLEGAGRLRDLQGCVLQAGALRHHAAQGRRRPSRRWSMPQPRRSTRAARARRSTTSGSRRRSRRRT